MQRTSWRIGGTWYLPCWLGIVIGFALIAAVLAVSQPPAAHAQRTKTSRAAAKEKDKDKGKDKTEEGEEKKEPAKPPWPYLELKVDTPLSRLRTVTIKGMLRGSEPLSPTFDDFFVKWFFPQLTREDNLDKLPEWRAELQSYFERAKRNPESTERLNQLTLDMMYALAIGARVAVLKDGRQGIVIRRTDRSGRTVGYQTLSHIPIPATLVKETKRPPRDFHPTVKYNAMLLIAGLNEKPPGRDTPAVPWLTALNPLVRVATANQAPSSLRVAALIGIARHIAVEDDGIKDIIASNMQKIVQQRPAPGGSADADWWIQRQAIDILGELGLPGPNGQFLATLAAMVADRDQPLVLRAAAAQAIGKIQPDALPANQANPLTRQLGTLLVDACQYEIEGGENGDQQVSWPRLATSLEGIQLALSAVEGFAGNEEQIIAKQVKNSISTLASELAESAAADTQQKQTLTRTMSTVKKVMAAPGTAVEEEDEPDEAPTTDGVPRPPVARPPEFEF